MTLRPDPLARIREDFERQNQTFKAVVSQLSALPEDSVLMIPEVQMQEIAEAFESAELAARRAVPTIVPRFSLLNPLRMEVLR